MFLLTLLSLTLFVVPIFVTFGAYFGVEYQKILSCGFHCGYPGGGSSLGTPGGIDLVGVQYCQKEYAITPAPGDYVFNPNQWGNDGAGALCLNFTSDNNPDGYAMGFSATWEYLVQGPENRPVRAFPNAGLTTRDNLPSQLGSISGLDIDVEWTYNSGSKVTLNMDLGELTTAELNANVCLDMFMAQDETLSSSTTQSDFEVMMWLGKFGDTVDPLGFGDGIVDTRIVGDTTFNLYVAKNQFGQLTFTWVASVITDKFVGNVGPLIHGLTAYNGPGPNDYLGYVAFGSETFFAPQNATFYVPRLMMDLHTF